MADICGDSVLTGQDGSIEFKPPGTSFCLDDFSDFGTDGTTSHIAVPCTHDFRVNDVVCFYETPGANLDSAFQASTAPSPSPYYVVAVDKEWIELASTAGGAAIVCTGDGGTGTANAGIIDIELCDFYAVCGVREFSLDISREELDVTVLPCFDSPDDGCSKLASFRQTQAGFASATGSMTVYFTDDQENISNRLLGSAVLKDQTGARAKLYVSTKTDANGVNDAASVYVDAYINVSGISLSVNPDDPTSADLSFSVKRMVSAFGLTA